MKGILGRSRPLAADVIPCSSQTCGPTSGTDAPRRLSVVGASMRSPANIR